MIGVGIIGLGYVGLPLGILCIENNYKVIGFEKDENRRNLLTAGKSYISDISDSQIYSAISSGSLYVTKDYNFLTECDIAVVCVPTPLLSDKTPDYSYLFDAVSSIRYNLKSGQLVIIESTIVPTTSRNEIIPFLEKDGLMAGRDFFFSFSPERIDPGNVNHEINSIPKLISGYSEKCKKLTEEFYSSLGIKTYPVSSLEVAEMSKILENTYRDVNIALVNELAQLCNSLGISIWDVVDAAATKPFGFSAFYPGPGVGGHCIPKDSSFYSYLAGRSRNKADLAECARKINDNMPKYIVSRIESILTRNEKNINGSSILILGVTYKKNVNDIRESPVIEIFKSLLLKGAKVKYHDPFIDKLNIHGKEYKSIPFEEIINNNSDCCLLAVGHTCYQNCDFSETNLILDATNSINSSSKNIEKL